MDSSNHSLCPINNDCCRSIHLPLLTDMYQITMAYAYWKNQKCNLFSVFDVFFRKNPFGGEFTIFAGLDECIKFLQGFRYSDDDIAYLKKILPNNIEEDFFDYLGQVTAKEITLYAIPEGSVVFPKIPLMRVEGPLLIVQLLETTLLTLVNYASLVTTNSARYRIALDGRDIKLLEFGLRRAQGPDGGLSASKYAYIGGFDATSNVLASKLYGIPLKGTHAHSYIMSYSSLDDIKNKVIVNQKNGENVDFVKLCIEFKREMSTFMDIIFSESSSTEFAAFISYAIAFPNSFVALVDTYDVIRSGILNFCAVALALNEVGYRAVGIRIDSGDLAYLSKVAFHWFCQIAVKYNIEWFSKLSIIASNDINEETIVSLNEQKHKINYFGIGTHLVTCERQPALGCVYKLVEIENRSCIKLSLDIEKVTIPGRKNVFRLFGKEGFCLVDLMQRYDESPPLPNSKVLCRHPYQESKRCYTIPSKVKPLLKLWWKDGKVPRKLQSLEEIRVRVQNSIKKLRPDIKRCLNPTPYKVSISDSLYEYMHRLWLENAPIGELS